MSRKKKKDNTGLLIAGGLGVAGLIWYLSRKPKSVTMVAPPTVPSMPTHTQTATPKSLPVAKKTPIAVERTPVSRPVITPVATVPVIKKKPATVVDKKPITLPIVPRPRINPNTALELLPNNTPKPRVKRSSQPTTRPTDPRFRGVQLRGGGLRDSFATNKNPFALR